VLFLPIPEDLGTYLGSEVDPARAKLIISGAIALCSSIVDPLPEAALSVVLDVAARAYTNPTAVPNQAAGPFTVGSAPGGLWLTRQNKATLRRLAGSGGAFTIETMPSTAGTVLPPWERNTWGESGVYGTDWDQTP
jgi:hypothetical protein